MNTNQILNSAFSLLVCALFGPVTSYATDASQPTKEKSTSTTPAKTNQNGTNPGKENLSSKNSPAEKAVTTKPNRTKSTYNNVHSGTNSHAGTSPHTKSSAHAGTSALTGSTSRAATVSHSAKSQSPATKNTAAHKSTVRFSSSQASVHKAALTRVSRPSIIPATVTADGKPIWLDVNSAQVAAKAQHKIIVADFFTSWCHWCKVLDKRTLQDPQVEVLLARNFVCMKADAEDRGAGQKLALRNNVHGYPTIILFRPNGENMGVMEGYVDAVEFIDTLTAIKDGKIPSSQQ